jgi:hypothetical protein
VFGNLGQSRTEGRIASSLFHLTPDGLVFLWGGRSLETAV